MKKKCLLIDDEPLALEVLANHINKIDDLEIVDKCNDAASAFNVLKNKQVDLVFLDIQMPEITGLEFLRSLSNPPKVIMTTAFREYAVDGFELDVVDYLLKPISFPRFMKAIDKYLSLENISTTKIPEKENIYENYIYIKADKKIHKIDFDEIIYIESLKDYLTIYTATRRLTTKQKISEMENILPADKFVRIHKSYIVSKNHISSFTPYSVEIGKKELTIGRTYKDSVFKALNFRIDN